VLTREIMGLLALGVLWVNTGLIVAVALKQLQNLRALGRRAREAAARGDLVSGTVASVGEGGRLALRHVHQTGRALTTKGPDRILFTDGPQSFEVLGGAVETDGGRVEVEPAGSEASEVWADEARAAEAAACPSPRAFDDAYRSASRFKGHGREIDVEVRAGDRVWVLGRRDGDRLGPGEGQPLVVSMVDPVAWARGKARLIVGFCLAALAGLALVTALALWPPHFGLVSTVGGALGLAYFLGIQPLGTAVRDAVKTPARRPVGGLWTRPAERGAAAAG
jgi:hypothetical protein